MIDHCGLLEKLLLDDLVLVDKDFNIYDTTLLVCAEVNSNFPASTCGN